MAGTVRARRRHRTDVVVIRRRLLQVGVVSGVATLPAAGLVDLPVLAVILGGVAGLVWLVGT